MGVPILKLGYWDRQPPPGTPFRKWFHGCRVMAAFTGNGVPDTSNPGLVLGSYVAQPTIVPVATNDGVSRAIQSDANTEAYYATTPDWLKLSFPITIAVGYTRLGSASNFADVAGVSYNDPSTSPYVAYGLYYETLSQLRLKGNNSGTLFVLNINLTPTVGQHYNILGRMATGRWESWVDGQSSATGSDTLGGPNYTSTSIVHVGSKGAVNPNCQVDYFYIFSGEGSLEMAQALNRNPWQIFEKIEFGGVVPIAAASSIAAISDYERRLCMHT